MSSTAKIVWISIATVLGLAILARMIWGCFNKTAPIEDEENLKATKGLKETKVGEESEEEEDDEDDDEDEDQEGSNGK